MNSKINPEFEATVKQVKNKPHEAFKILKICGTNITSIYGLEEAVLDSLEKLVEKETAKKVTIIDRPELYYIYYCPTCGANLLVDRNKQPKHLFNYCGKCSQKLDWD